MKPELIDQPGSIIFIPHGGGPLPLLGDKGHSHLLRFLKELPAKLAKPSAILVISAHWEENAATITSGKTPALIYDYYGFPEQAYQIKYPVPGNPVLAEKIFDLLKANGIPAKLDERRGFDHGLFVPLKIMFPDAAIPCVQLSLINNLNPALHIRIGKALAELKEENVLIVGSGFSFHNLNAFFSGNDQTANAKNLAFEDWLIETCTNGDISMIEREQRLINWRDAPFARFCHPREEHLLPLHVCFGLANSPAKLVFSNEVLGKKACGFLW